MNKLYTKEDLGLYERQKSKLLRQYFVVLFLFIVVVTALTIFAKRNAYIVNLIINILLSIAFVVFSFLFLGIKVQLAQKYKELGTMLANSKSETLTGQITKGELIETTLNGLQYLELQVKTGSTKAMRRVFLQAEKLGQFQAKDKVDLELRSNIIFGYSEVD